MRNIGRQINRIIIALILIVFVIGMSGATSTVHAQSKIPVYDGSASVSINGNIPSFSVDEITTESYEYYGELDNLGRCTIAEACIGQDLMPTQERGSIGSVKPTGWVQNKYPGIVDSEPPYLYNRCHMIGFQLTGEDANERNLITGTRYMNIEGMLSYEYRVVGYIMQTGNHVMYRVTPVFIGDNLLCSGVQIEALSVEDNGKGICFNAFCFNVQPGVVIDYSTGDNYADDSYESGISADDFVITTPGESESGVERFVPDAVEKEEPQYSYIANKNSKKFHYPYCKSVEQMNEKNKLYFDGTREELIEKGYSPCKNCNP